MIYNCSPAVFLHWDCSPEKLWLCRRFSEKEKADWKRSESCPRNPWIFSTASSLGRFHLAVGFRCSTEHQRPLEKGWWLRCPAAIFGFSSLRTAEPGFSPAFFQARDLIPPLSPAILGLPGAEGGLRPPRPPLLPALSGGLLALVFMAGLAYRNLLLASAF